LCLLLGELEDRPAHAEFGVVGVGAEDEDRCHDESPSFLGAIGDHRAIDAISGKRFFRSP
jgi:hypothetical protein